MIWRFRGIGFLLLSFMVNLHPADAGKAINSNLPYPLELHYKVEFWKAIYTKYTTREGLLHDAEDLSVIYEAIQLPKNGDLFEVDRERARIRENLFSILRKGGEGLTHEERQLLSKFPKGATRSRLLQATENIRFQLGQTDRFREGVIRSGYYMKHIQEILRQEGLPDFLRFLPHVESSFQEYAISKFGAAGLWQLMEQTGKLYLKVNYVVDERLDPWIATRAAARHLKKDFETLGSWPLAITAYNHGTSGVQHAVTALGTNDIAEIAFRYTSPSFGFASRNFYVQFLAAAEVAKNPEKYFGSLHIPAGLEFETVQIPRALYYREFAATYKFTTDEFRKLNPGLRPPVIENRRMIPAGMVLRVPLHSKRIPLLVASLDRKASTPKIAVAIPKLPQIKTPAEPVKLPSHYKISDLKDGKGWIRLEMNETVAQIADWLKCSLSEMRSWNAIEEDGQARLGQRLIVKLDHTTSSDFENAREEYHRSIREDFFARYEVLRVDSYEVRRGENLWSICYQRFDVPPWLLEEYNEGTALTSLTSGTKLRIPVLREKDGTQVSSAGQ